MLDKAESIHSVQEDLGFDLEKVISGNRMFNEFFDLNKETSSIFNNFWQMLQNT
jgi:hypothetical protein